MLEERIAKRISELEAERDRLIEQANMQIAAYQGAIAELKRLIESEPEAATQMAPAQAAQPAN